MLFNLLKYTILAMRLRPAVVLGRFHNDEPFSLQSLLTRSWFKILGCFLILYFSLVQYYRHANYRDPTSYFFDPTRAYDRLYSADRIREADAFIQSAGSRPAGPILSLEPPVMCIGIATVKRREEQYVRTTVGSLLEGLSTDERHDIYLNILIGHTNQSNHPIASENWVEALPNKVLEYKQTDFARIEEWEAGGWYRNKTIFDYTYLLNDCYATGAEYIAMIEDDTLAVRGWYPRALTALRNVEARMARRPNVAWVYMRLFYVEDLFGWNSEFWPTYLFWSFVVWTIATALLGAARSRLRSFQSFLSDESMLLLTSLCIPALIALFFACGRNSNWPLAPGIHEMNKNGCCSQGYVFPRSIVPSLLEKADLETDWLVDMMVEKIADEEGWIRWATSPALLQHIGSTSSKGYGFDTSAKHLWNFGFELYHKAQLDGSHV